MKIQNAPLVYLVGAQSFIESEVSEFLDGEGLSSFNFSTSNDSLNIPEMAGRICYMSFQKPRPGGNSAYIKHIKEVGHGSVLEHTVYNFVISGISRSLSHELVRHRAGWSYSMLSQRYVDESVADYIIPDIIEKNEELKAIWMQAIEASHRAYCDLAEQLTLKLNDQSTAENAMLPPDANWTDIRKAARQAARSVLPNATETKIFVTVNARALRHFFELRGSRHADPEIRKLANEMHLIIEIHSPALFNDYVKTELPDGTFELTTPYPKV